MDILTKEKNDGEIKYSRGYGVLALILIGFIFWLGLDAWHGIMSCRWPYTEGKIVSLSEGYVPSYKGGHREAKITYSYKVNEQEYEGHRISFQTYQLSKLAADYVQGQSVSVFYAPEDPANETVLKPGITLETIVGLAFFAILTSTNIYATFCGRVRRGISLRRRMALRPLTTIFEFIGIILFIAWTAYVMGYLPNYWWCLP